MVFALHVIVMSSAFFNPSFAFSSHFDTGKGQADEGLGWGGVCTFAADLFVDVFHDHHISVAEL